MGSIVRHIDDLIEEYGSIEAYLDSFKKKEMHLTFTQKRVVTKECPDCAGGREVVYFFKDSHSSRDVMRIFQGTPEYEPGRAYLIDTDENSLVYHIYELHN